MQKHGPMAQTTRKALLALVVAAAAALPGPAATGGKAVAPSYSAYVVATDAATMGAPGWKKVVDALKKKHRAKVVSFDARGGLDKLVAELRKSRPKYVCFVLRPESAGRAFIVSAAQAMRRIDDDPYGDAIWGVITGYDAEDALKVVAAPPTREIRSMATSMGGDRFLDAYDSGFASDERTADNFWMKRPGGANEKVPTGGNIAKALADAFSSQPVDYFITSGHASERDWQIVYNQNRGTLVHTKDAQLQFVEPGGVRHDVKGASLRVYVGAGNCLIGHVDSRACMATAWMHAAGVEQFAGYTVTSWYGFMGWGVAGLFGDGRYSLAEARYLTNERLLWAKARRHPASEDQGLDYDRDVFAYYGDPKQRIAFPVDRTPYTVAVSGAKVKVAFTRDCEFARLDDVKGASPVMALLDAPPPGDTLFDANGAAVPDAVVTERFVFIPAPGRHAAGETLEFTIGKAPGEAKAGKGK